MNNTNNNEHLRSYFIENKLLNIPNNSEENLEALSDLGHFHFNINDFTDVNVDIFYDKNNIKKEELIEESFSEAYWISLGLKKSQCAIGSLYNLSYNDIFSTIISQNIKFFNNFHKIVPDTNVWCIDGTCATGKSSTFKDMNKTNRFIHSIGQNTHPGGAMGYYFKSLKIMSTAPVNSIWDRTPYNNIFPWYSIWMILSHIKANTEEYITNFNSYTSLLNNNKIEALNCNIVTDKELNIWNNFLDNIHTDVLKSIVNSAKTILIVDSNEKVATERLYKRAKNSDVFRSSWPCYIKVQNYAYALMALKFPENFCIIDLNTLGNDQNLMQTIIKDIIEKYPIIENKKKLFEPLQPETPLHFLNKKYEDGERLRPILTSQFCSNIKNINI
uniref:Uncharacterized protein n=1 Tax=Faxonius propinquus nudivirus TaxID=3139431 RepID=A0AAU8GCV2_9VIRU